MDQSENQTNDKVHETDAKIVKSICIAVVLVFGILVSGISTCNVMNKPEETKLLEAETNLKIMQQEKIMQLIEQGVDPIVARCTVIGWRSDAGAAICTIKSNHGNQEPK